MKSDLLDLGLPERVVDEILSVFELYQASCRGLSKPKGPEEMTDHMVIIASLAGRLSEKLGKLSRMEKQLLDQHCFPGCFEIQVYLNRLNLAAKENEGQHFKSARRPFLMELARNLKTIFEKNSLTITTYRRTLWVQAMSILLGSPAGAEDQSFNILRQLLRK